MIKMAFLVLCHSKSHALQFMVELHTNTAYKVIKVKTFTWKISKLSFLGRSLYPMQHQIKLLH